MKDISILTDIHRSTKSHGFIRNEISVCAFETSTPINLLRHKICAEFIVEVVARLVNNFVSRTHIEHEWQ